MKRHLIVLLAVITIGTCPVTASENRNGARWYAEAIEHLDRLSPQDRERLQRYADMPHVEASDATRTLLARLNHASRLARRGSQQAYCDFGVDYNDYFAGGSKMHAYDVRGLATLVRAQAKLRLEAGDGYGWAETLGAAYRMAQHLTEDRLGTSSSVAYAILQQADIVTQMGIDQGQLTPDLSRQLLEAVESLDADDPLRYSDAFCNEFLLKADWYEHLYEQGSMEKLEERLKVSNEDGSVSVAGLDSDEFSDLLGQIRSLGNAVDDVVRAEDGTDGDVNAELEEIVQYAHEIGLGELIPSVQHITAKALIRQRAKAMLTGRIKTLREAAEGEAVAGEVANAAIWYARGARLIDQFGDVDLARLIESIARGEAKEDQNAVDELAELLEAISVFQAGSRIDRCDFSVVRAPILTGAEDLVFIPDYVPGIIDGLRVLHARTEESLGKDDTDAAADQLTACYRVISHLSGDPVIISALSSHFAFRETVKLTRVAMGHENWDEDNRETMWTALRQFSVSDPFGYTLSISTSRSALAVNLTRLSGPGLDDLDSGEGDPNTYLQRRRELVRWELKNNAENRRMMKKWDENRLLFCLAVLDTLVRSESEAGAEDGVATELQGEGDGSTTGERNNRAARRLSLILSLDNLEMARAKTSAVAPLLMRGEVDAIGQISIPSIAPIAKWRRAAQSDVRAICRLMMPAKTRDDVEAGEDTNGPDTQLENED